MRPSVAILAAHVREIEPLLARAHARRVARDRTGTFWRGRVGDTPVELTVGGMGRRRARAAAAAALDRGGSRFLLVVGVAGALSRELAVGDVVTAETVATERGDVLSLDARAVRAGEALGARRCGILTVDRMVTTAADRAALLAGAPRPAPSQPMIVDMESFDAVAAAHARGVPAVVLRAVSDASHEELPVFLDRSRGGDGDLDVRRVLIGAMMHPGAIPILIRLRRRVRACAVALSRVAAELVCSLDLEPSDLADHGPAAAAEAARLDTPLAGDRSAT